MRVQLLFSVVAVFSMAVTSGATQAGRTPADLLRAQLDEDWTYWMAQYPETATAFGYPGQNGGWTGYSEGAIAARSAYLNRSVQRVVSIDRSGLGAEDQVTYDLYRDLLETAAKGLEFNNDAMPIRGVIPHNLRMPLNQIEGVQQDVPSALAQMPAVTREDYENIIARLQTAGRLVD